MITEDVGGDGRKDIGDGDVRTVGAASARRPSPTRSGEIR